MKFFSKQFFPIIGIIVLSVCVFLTYKDITRNFFEQDEWAVLAYNIVFGQLSSWEKIKFLFSSSGILSHFIPLTMYSFYLMNKVFGLQMNWYFFTIIIVHVTNSICVFLLTRKLIKNELIALCAGLFFGINWASSQAVTWFAAAFGVQFSTFFFLSSVLLYCIFLENKNKKIFFTSVVLFIFSFLFKESTLTLIIIYPLLFSYFKKISILHLFRKKNRGNFLWFFISVIFFFIFKIILLYVNPYFVSATIGNTSQAPFILIPRILFYPLLAFSQIYDPGGIIFHLATPFIHYEYPALVSSDAFSGIVATIGPDVLYLLLSFLLLQICFITILHMKKKHQQTAYFTLLGMVSFFASILPYVPLPRFISFLELRYYYTPNIFASMILAVCLWYWVSNAFFKKYTVVIVLILTGTIVFFHYQQIQKDLYQKLLTAKERKALLTQMKLLLPGLSEKINVFFMTGDGYDYLLPGLKIPFQSGFGNILMIEYYDNTHITPKLVDNNYLYGLKEQGYKMYHGVGFGYYFEKDMLLRDLKNKKFFINSIHAFSWDRKKEKLYDITTAFQKNITKQL